MHFRGDQRARHAPPKQTRAQTRMRLVDDLIISTDTALEHKTAEALHAGSYSSLPFAEIANLLEAEREQRALSPEERFARVLAQSVGPGLL